MKILRTILLTILVGMIGSTMIYAEAGAYSESYVDTNYGAYAPLSNFTQARKLAMGNVQGPTAEGFSALFMNPAGIVRENQVQLLSAGVGVNANMDPIVVDGLLEAVSSFDGSWENLNGVIPYADFRNGVGGSVQTLFGASYAGFAAAVNYNADLQVRRFGSEAPVTLEYISETSFAGGGSYGISMGSGTLYVGLGVRQIYQAHAIVDLDADEIPELLGHETGCAHLPAVLGTGLGVDAGAIFETGPLLVSLNVKNIAGTRLSCQEGMLEEAMSVSENILSNPSNTFSPDLLIPSMSGDDVGERSIPMSVIIGAGVKTELLNVLEMELAGDYEQVLWFGDDNSESDTFWKNLHLGGEIDLLDTVQLRGGVNQGYLTGGIGVSVLKIFNLLDVSADVTYYAWEMGSYAGHRQSEAMKFDLVFSL